MRRRLRALTASLVAGVALTVAGCGGGGGDSSDPAASGGSAENFPVTIDHTYGSTVIPEQPTRIVALSNEEDTLATLGITPIAFAKNPVRPTGDYPWLDGRIDLSGATALDLSTEVNLEQIASLQPDLILATNFYEIADYYDQLSQIAPTVGPAEEPGLSTWQETSTLIGKAVGRSADVEKAIGETEDFVSSFAAEHPGLKDKTLSSAYYYEAGKFAVIDDPDTTSLRLYGELGMTLSPSITEHVVDRSLSEEQMGALDADVVFIGYASDDLKASLNQNPLFTQIPAVRDGRVAEVDQFAAGVMNNPTILNIPWQLEQFEPVLAKAAG